MKTGKAGLFIRLGMAICLLMLCSVPPADCASLDAFLATGKKINSFVPTGCTINEVEACFSRIRFSLDGDGGAYPPSLYPDEDGPSEQNLLATVVALTLGGEKVGNQNQDWYCYTGKVSLNGKPLPALQGKGGAGKWRAAVLIGGSGKFYQGKSLFFPEGTLTTEELNAFLRQLRKRLPGAQNREPGDGMRVLEAVSQHNYMNTTEELRIVCYMKEVGPDSHEIVLVLHFPEESRPE